MNDPAIPVTLLPAEVEATKKFYGIEHWPTDIGHVDLGQIPRRILIGIASLIGLIFVLWFIVSRIQR